MKFRVNTTLKASALADLGGIITPGHYDTQSLNFPAEMREVLIAEAEDPRGHVVCLDPEDIIAVEEERKDVSSEVLDNISSGEGKAEELHENPPLGEQDESAEENTAQAPSPISDAKPAPKKAARPKPVVKK